MTASHGSDRNNRRMKKNRRMIATNTKGPTIPITSNCPILQTNCTPAASMAAPPIPASET
jgi:hypothetical protein